MLTKRFILGAMVAVCIASLITLLIANHGRVDSLDGFARQDMWRIAGALEQFETAFRNLPNGEDFAIHRAILGSNDLQLNFLGTGRTNTGGKVIDPWGTPFQIQIVGRGNFVVRSAGRNRRFGDKDDLVFDSVSNAKTKP